jgi:hypothetical protein
VIIMMKRDYYLLAGALIFALIFLVVPVAADKYVVTSSSSNPTAGAVVTITAQLSFDNNTALATSGKTVTWTRTPSSGTFSAATSTTNSNGIATVTFTTATTGGIAYYFTATDGDGTTGTSAVVTTAVVSPTISSLDPSSATNGGSQTVVIAGSGFGTSGTQVTLTKSGETTILGTATGTDSATSLTRLFPLSGKSTGPWTLTVLNSDGGSDTETFTVSSATAATVTSISPVSGIANDTVSVTIAGNGFTATSAKIRLYNSGNYIIGTVNSGGSTTTLTGSFDLDYATPATYDVCVLADGSDASKVCGPTFKVVAENAVNGSIYFTSSPSSAKVWFNSVYKDTTPFTLEDVIPGTYTVKMQRTSYLDWSQSVTVVAGEKKTVSATLVYPTVTTTPVATTIIVTTATLPPTTVKSSIEAPTPWPSDTPAPESPLSVLVVVGALVTGIVVLRKK